MLDVRDAQLAMLQSSLADAEHASEHWRDCYKGMLLAYRGACRERDALAAQLANRPAPAVPSDVLTGGSRLSGMAGAAKGADA